MAKKKPLHDPKFQTYLAQNISNEIRLADTKASWSFGVLGVLTAALSNKIASIPWETIRKPTVMTMLVIAVLLLVLAFKHIIAVIYPRITQGTKKGISYYENIQQYKKEEYNKKSLNITKEEAIQELANLTYGLSGVASKKYKHLRLAILATLTALIWILIIIAFF